MPRSEPAVPPRIAPDHLYNYAQAAEVLGVSKYFVRNLVRDGRIKSVRVNDRGDRRLYGENLIEWLKNGGVQ
jgi:excisionase family DNA binding protein